MRKAERLFQLITILRGRRLAITAKQLAITLEVSERTIYRDIQALLMSGVPIEGEAGIGYILDKSFDLPPLMFSSEELLALMLGSKMVKTWADQDIAKAAISALDKITSVLPEHIKNKSDSSYLLVPEYFRNPQHAEKAKQLRAAIKEKHIIKIHYRDEKLQESTRCIEPLGLVFWGGKWTVISFCVLRQQYREFRIDRILTLTLLDESFVTTETKCLEDYLSAYQCE